MLISLWLMPWSSGNSQKKEVHFLDTFALCVCWFSKTPDNQ